jgi:hypothetical protein
MEKDSVFAFCWYDEAQWLRLKALYPDTLDDSYATWHRNAGRAMHELSLAGHRIKKVAFKLDEWLRWCAEQGIDPDAKSRSAYAAWKLQRRSK